MTEPRAEVIAMPVGLTVALATTLGDPSAEVIAIPVGLTLALATVVTEPNAEVIDMPVGETLASASTVTLPSADVMAPGEDTVTGNAVPQAPSFQVPRPHPLILAITDYLELRPIML